MAKNMPEKIVMALPMMAAVYVAAADV